MTNIDRFSAYFRNTRTPGSLPKRIGMEVETSFTNIQDGKPISADCSQRMLRKLPWKVVTTKGDMITVLETPDGSRVLYELGRQNLELSLAPYHAKQVVSKGVELLNQIYSVAESVGAEPHFSPILDTNEDLLIVPDERDANWVMLDGRPALNLLTKCSAVQFTFDISYQQAISYIAKLISKLPVFLRDYPQDQLWRRYITESEASYKEDRYGGPLTFESVEDYCTNLLQHDVVSDGVLVPQNQISNYDLNTFIRSVWWYFRLRNYNNTLCLEVRPLPRRTDNELYFQLQQVLDYMN